MAQNPSQSPLRLVEGEEGKINLRARFLGKSLKRILQEFQLLELQLYVTPNEVFFKWIVVEREKIFLGPVEYKDDPITALKHILKMIYQSSLRAQQEIQ